MESDSSTQSTENSSSWRTFMVAVTSGLLLWLAFPPVGLWWVAWVAPVGWIWLIRLARLPGKRPYCQLYLAGLFHWLLVVHWIRLPHWSAYFGWLALAGYLAAYLPLFVGLSRIVARQLRLPSIVAAPVAWTGLELFRGHFLTGFSMGLLGHTQATIPSLIQVADIFGAYGISFAIVWVSTCVAMLLPAAALADKPIASKAFVAIVLATAMLAAIFGYGKYQLGKTWRDDAAEPLKIALIQGSMDTTFEEDNRGQTLDQYLALTRQAIEERPDTELIVWPESMYPNFWIDFEEPFTVPASDGFAKEELMAYAGANARAAIALANHVGRTMLVGSPGTKYHGERVERYNSAQWLVPDADPSDTARYHKMHPVIFGEYVPGGEWFPWLYRLTPMPNGLTPGMEAVALEKGGVILCPNICYENTVPHLIRRQVRELAAAGTDPDALVTITNDGWFWGSSQLDFHLACGIMRSVELRRPQFIAANTGFSAWIDAHGRVVEQGPRRETGIIYAEAKPRVGPDSLYQRWGDIFGWLCTAVCVAALVKSVARPL